MEAALKTPTFGKYQLIASLGQGGMANVYLALVAGPGGFNKLLVVKSLREEVVNNIDGGMEMFLDEARLTARLVHPNIVTTYEVGEVSGTYFLAMEYLEGQTYRAVINRGRAAEKLPIEDELRILSETARGLHYAHELTNYDGTPLNVVHRDVSPQNVFITYDGLVKLLDFGIAKTSEAEHMTQVGVIKGKIDYIAPEQLRGDSIDRRSDVFALGAMLWEAITGKRFAGGRKVPDVTKAQHRLLGTERKVREVQPGVPEELAQIVERATAVAVGDRYESAAAFADALDAYLASAGLRPTAKTLSSVVMPLFEEERARIRKTIEEQIALSKQRGAGKLGQAAALPAMRADYADSVSGIWIPPEPGTGTSGEDTGRQPRSLASLAPGPRTSSAPAAAPPAHSRLPLALGIVAAVAMGAGGFALRGNATTHAPAATATPTAPVEQARGVVQAPPAMPAPVAPANEAPAAAVVRLDLTVVPDTAQVTLDGAPLKVPFAGEFRPDRTLHHLDMSAEGYLPIKQLIAFEHDATLQFKLEKAPPTAVKRGRVDQRPSARAAASEPAAEPVTAPAPPPAPAPASEILTPKRTRVRSLDSDDPYAN